MLAVGGGGLIAGIGGYLKAVRPEIEVVGCWPENSPVMLRCLEAGRVIDVPEQATLSESTAGGLEPGSVTLDICKRVIDRCMLVTEEEIASAMRRPPAQLREEQARVLASGAIAAEVSPERRSFQSRQRRWMR